MIILKNQIKVSQIYLTDKPGNFFLSDAYEIEEEPNTLSFNLIAV